ncbi:MAG: prohibitin family protein [Sediminibacterium sp.]|jgi:regulator of protease activity HflC (stomatin/prohibitin superfamily)|uniref:prohibitin family protein n=1 Tax=Sediminibacterium sp. TaxID=1917865 RepID=UPI00202CDAD0|nr:prohibitin family protein [Sediminibacterium sp.]MDZ4072085.1 prohibitin family protein [Sediminibacterium sp.]
MVAIILGVIILIVGIVLKNQEREELRKLAGGIRILALIIIIVGFLTSCIKQIDAGQIGVKSLFGKVSDDVLTSGLNMVNPLVDVKTVDIKTQNYTMSGVHDESTNSTSGDDAIKVLTADGLEVVIDLTVLYRVIGTEAPRIVRETGLDYKDKIVRPLTRTKIRDNAVYFTAIELYSNRRDDFQNRIFKSIETDFKKRGLILEQLLVRNITLPANVKTSIEEKIKAEQEAQKMEFVLQKEKQEAERKRVEAQGIADYQRIMSSGLTDKQLQYEQIQVLKGLVTSPNSKVIVMGKGNTPVILDTKDQKN